MSKAFRTAEAPLCDTAGINMNETGTRIVSDASAAKRKSSTSQIECGDSWETYIDCPRLHVETVLGYAGGVGSQEFVAPWRTVAADDRYLGIGLPRRGGKIGQKIKQMRVVVKLLTGAVVTQKVIQFGEGVVEVSVAKPVDDVDVLAGVSMEQT